MDREGLGLCTREKELGAIQYPAEQACHLSFASVLVVTISEMILRRKQYDYAVM